MLAETDPKGRNSDGWAACDTHDGLLQVIAIVGNKCDLEDKREVEKELAQGCTSCPLVRY